jgi:predicted outer membrane repeat protein
MRTKHLVIILVLLALALPAPRAQAGGVVTVCDEAHLLAALAGGGMVTFACSGVIFLTNTIVISADTTIDGSGQSVTISGNDTVRVLDVNSGSTLSLNQLTIADGASDNGGGGIDNHGTLIATNCAFANNSGSGGGAINNSQGSVTVNQSSFLENRAIYVGGAVYSYGGDVTISGSTFTGSSSADGGAIRIFGSTLTVSDCAFSSNSATGNGGGIASTGFAVMSVSDSSFVQNSANGGGGGIENHGTLTVSNCTLSSNRARFGGAVNSDGTLTVSNTTFASNSASGEGSRGGAVESKGTTIVSDSTFSANEASWSGGGMSSTYGTVGISNSTFSGNGAHIGGGLWSDYSAVIMTNSTFSGNSGGNIDGPYSTTTLKNTIVANSLLGSNCQGHIVDGGGNLSYPDTTCPGINLNPLLYPLQDNGGPTQTMALGPGSGALDTGDDAPCATAPVNNLDQRGDVRPKGPRCDIGAIEQEPYPKKWLPLALRRG